MDDLKAAKIESEIPEIIIISSAARGLKYLFDHDQGRMAISGQKGCTILTMAQARALRDELSDIIEDRKYYTQRKIYKKI
jgi:hypothetical protein